MEKLLQQLKNPPKEYRPIPFWSWNDKLDPDMLKWQINEMDKAGLGGYFMHARGGLQTKYLGKEWMECIKACIKEGNKTGMGSWCYDEEGWPSGFAGGIVTAMGDKYHVRHIEISEVSSKEELTQNNILGIYRLNNNSGEIKRISLEEVEINLNECYKQFVVNHKSNPCYIDILNKDVVKAFIEVTYEKYYKTLKEDFGKGMPGFFTDEPQYSRELIPWSYILPYEFEKKYGYNILDMLPALFIECKGYEKFRYDYWGLVNELYVKSFGEQIYKWCDQHNCKLTGHIIQEDSLLWQMYCCAGVMPFYEYMHTPGMDWLGRRIESPLVPKQVSSVANQLGKKFVISETFALCGWDVSFEELKWIAEWQFVNGVNLICQHLESYSLRGLRKRDYPPSLFYQQSWWKEYSFFNDYFARLSLLLTSGKKIVDVLLIHPIKSAWIVYNNKNNETIERLNRDFVRATETLSGFHVDHDYGDETIISKYGRVDNDKFIIGQCEYSVVVLPSMITIDQKTIDLLNLFIDNGGKVISIGQLPTLSNGYANNKVNKFIDIVIKIGEKDEKLYALLKKMSLPTISIADEDGEIESIHYQQRDLGNQQIFFMVNHNQKESFDAVIIFKGIGQIQKYIVESSEIETIQSITDGTNTKIKLEFLPMQSHVIIFNRNGNLELEMKEELKREISLKDNWYIEDAELNSLTLDYCSYRVNNGKWNGPIPAINVMNTLLKMKENCNVSLRFNFEINMDLSKNKELYIVVESAEKFEIFVNGQQILYTDKGWWKDSSFKKVDIKPYAKCGQNEVILKREFYQSPKVYDVLFGENILESEKNKLTYDVELESIYVIGDFGVVSKSGYTFGERKAVFTDGPFVIVEKPQKVKKGDLNHQGFCFFAGSIELSQDINIQKNSNERIIIRFDDISAPLSKVFVNDVEVRSIWWKPYSVDITEYVDAGKNKITFQLFASNRNLLGPHHNPRGELYAVTPSSFSDDEGWMDRYCFVRFGF